MLANPAYNKTRRARQGHSHLLLLNAILLLTLVVGLICAWLILQTVASFYAGRIYPNVYVLGIALGKLTPEEAAAVLSDAAPNPDTGMLILRDASAELTTDGALAEPTTGDERRWSVPWSEAGMRLDVTATVQAAFAIGHADPDQRLRDQVRTWLKRHDVAPVFTVDPEMAQAVLERLSPNVTIPPTDATLRFEGNQVVALPGKPGRELDVEATLAQLLALATTHNQVELVFRAVPPRIADVTPLQAQAEEMLGRRVELSAYDVLTDETFTWSLDSGVIATWLRVEREAGGEGREGNGDLAVRVDKGAVGATLAELAAGLGERRGLRLEEATAQVLNVFDAGGGTVALYLTHPQRSYVVQAGDTLSGIAAALGMPTWLILQANPDLDANWLRVGQELLIPSQDVLVPYLPVPGKRVTISIAEQRMRVYENGALLHQWPVSTGIADSPTSTGVFQVLSKEEEAYASLWDLWMPHFVAIYPAGPDFYNGVHGLPTLSSGRRLWEGLLGSPASYGCIILGLEQAETFYQWAEVGVVVVIE